MTDANDFQDWMNTTEVSDPKGVKDAWENEISDRAFLLARLGYPKKKTEKRLKANLTWEFERVGSASTLKRVKALVNEAYRRAGTR